MTNDLKNIITQGSKGVMLINEYQTIAGTCTKVRERIENIEIIEVRSKDFIVLTDKNKKIWCKLPENKKDGSEIFWLKENNDGFIRHYKDSFTDSRGLVEVLTETAYILNN